MKQLRILFPFIGGGTVGGSHISALKLIAGLDRDRFDPTILLHDLDGTGPGRLGEYIHSLGLSYQTLSDVPIMAPSHSTASGHTSFGTYLTRTLPALRRYLIKGGYDIVHTNDGRMHVNWALPTRLAGCKLIWHHREDPTSFGANTIAPFLANRIVTVSNFARPSRPLLPVKKRTHVVYSPFEFEEQPDREAARTALLDEINAGKDPLLIGFFGSLVPRKRPVEFVQAVAETVKALPNRDVHGLLFGEAILPHAPLDRDALELADRLGIRDRIHMMGFRRPINGPMAAMDATIVTAVNEPFGRTLIEAMHLGVPVIATQHGGNMEAIEDGRTGRLVPTDDAGAFADAIVHLEGNPDDRASLVAAARDDLVNRYGAERHIQQISQIYEDFLS
ncbi:glycosyltransferase family 4 protein [uncultured Aliiroseovarius sp.]|uniref:glycosyltransferase family 4 protein n=1 Tax=uncultured Aliiroseovarius sp. TaxID=1658783 RepID=UPI00260A638D|nr:glycosyltransferase family 4 protein [uncultured Aliiroseovarius sp.]